MKIFLDTANTEEICRCLRTGCISGVTTNPSIISREAKPLKKCIGDIKQIGPDLTVLVEAVSKEAEGMIEEAREYVGYGSGIVIKLPMTDEGLKATRVLSREGINIAVTLVFSLNQAIAAACAGAAYVAPFVGRLDDIDMDGVLLVSQIKRVFSIQGSETKVIAASIRTPQSVSMLFEEGCDIVTMPGKIFEAMLKHPLTDAGLKKFEEDWMKVPK